MNASGPELDGSPAVKLEAAEPKKPEHPTTLASVDPASWTSYPDGYTAALIQQYVVYVTMADQVSARRATANTFFLGLHTAVLTLFGVLWERPPSASAWWLIFPLLALLAACAVWFSQLASYRKLNEAKYAIVNSLEASLPAAPWAAEWRALGGSNGHGRYTPLTVLEQGVPVVFAAVYVVAFVAAQMN